jgi:hypothetical protein
MRAHRLSVQRGYAKETLVDETSFAGLTRRASLMTLGASGLVAFVNSKTAGAKKHKKKKKGDVNKLCKRQIGACSTFLTARCGGQPYCAAALACCSILGSCDATAFFTCFNEAVAS